MKVNRYRSIGMIAIGTLVMTAWAETAHAGLDCVSIANECTGSIIVPEQSTELGTVSSPMSLLFPLFDSTFGTLTGANVVVSGTMYTLSTSSVKNISGAPQTFSAGEDAKFSLSDTTRPASSLGLALSSGLFSGFYLDPKATQNYTALASGTSASFGPYVTTGSATLANTLGSGSSGIPLLSLADMQADGGGTDTLGLNTATTTSNTGAGGNVQESFSTNAALDISVFYDFTPAPPVGTPEPATMAVLGSGLAALGLLRRRKKSA